MGGGKPKSSKEQTEEGKVDQVKTNTNENKNKTEQELNTETEEATIMGADTKLIGVSGLKTRGKLSCKRSGSSAYGGDR